METECIKFIVETYLIKTSWKYLPFTGNGFCIVYPTIFPSGHSIIPIAFFEVQGSGPDFYSNFGLSLIRPLLGEEILNTEIYDSPKCELSKKDYERARSRYEYLPQVTTELLRRSLNRHG